MVDIKKEVYEQVDKLKNKKVTINWSLSNCYFIIKHDNEEWRKIDAVDLLSIYSMWCLGNDKKECAETMLEYIKYFLCLGITITV